MKNSIYSLWHYLESTCTLETDAPEEQRRKITLVVITCLCVGASIIWGTIYYAILGPVIATFITYGFTVVVGISLLIFFVTKRFNLLLYVFFFMILWNPIAMQWSLGGFAASGVLMTWSFLAPFCSLMFQNIRKALWWLSIYLIFLVISLYFDDYFSQWAFPISQKTSMLFFGMNIIGPLLVVFSSMMYFVNALQKEKAKVSEISDILEKELQKGRKVQENFLPNTLPEVKGCEIEAYFHPARQLSGDFYDVFLCPPGRAAFVIADVSDKGVGSALFMALTRSLIRIFSGTNPSSILSPPGGQFHSKLDKDPKLQKILETHDILHTITRINDYLAVEHGDEGMFVTLFFGVYEISSGSLSYINCGHEPLLIVDEDGIKNTLKPTGPALGAIPEVEYQIAEIILEPGDIFLGFTDGVTEACSPANNLFTKKRLEQSVEGAAGASANRLVETIRQDLFSFIDNAPQSDDITILAVKREES